MSTLTGLEVINSQKTVLKFFGIWPLEKETPFYRFRFYVTVTICAALALVPLAEMYNRLHDYGVLSELFTVMATPLSFCLKAVTFNSSKAYFIKLLKNVEAHPVDATEKEIRGVVKLSRVLTVAYPAWYVTSATVFSLQPLFGEEILPVKFSYDLGRYLNVMYVYQCVAAEICCIGLAYFDCLAINFMNIGRAKLEILARRIVNTSNIPRDALSQEFSEIIDQHNGLIQYIYCIEQVFTFSFLATFFHCLAAICNNGLQLTLVDMETTESSSMVTYLFCMLYALALYCWFGNEVIVKSQKVLEACYECSWYEWDNQTRQSIFIIMERSKRPLKLTAAKFGTLSLEAFAYIIRMSYSFFTVMQQMYKRHKQTKEN